MLKDRHEKKEEEEAERGRMDDARRKESSDTQVLRASLIIKWIEYDVLVLFGSRREGHWLQSKLFKLFIIIHMSM